VIGPDEAALEQAGARRATRFVFLLGGIGVASWAPMVPYAKARLALDDAGLGRVLLCMGAGATAAMPLAGLLTHRHGNRSVVGVSAIVVAVALPLLTLAPSAVALGAALALFGGALGVLDVAMNAHAVEVERREARPLMSGFHGLYSVGGLVGSAGMSALLRAGAPLVHAAVAVSLLWLVVIATEWRRLLAHVEDPDARRTPRSRRPSVAALFLGVLCMFVFLAEGSMLDWSAVFLRDVRGFDARTAGLGYAAFSIAMAAGRLWGDRITAWVGPVTIVRAGGLVAAAGFLLAAAMPSGALAFAGFVLVGAGASNIVPVLFSAAGRLPGAPAGISIATVTAIGYAGMLAGPAAIGVVAEATSLAVAFAGVAALLVAVALAAGKARQAR
jgi:predicted MFS family arabinose efflux permease